MAFTDPAGQGEQHLILDMVREARKKGEWHAYGIGGQGYLRLELDATVVHNYQLAYVPGLYRPRTTCGSCSDTPGAARRMSRSNKTCRCGCSGNAG
jgi:hypothetical protein